MQLFRPICLTSWLIAGVVLPGCDDKKREATFSEFLSENDPALKTKRDEIVAMIAEINKKRDYLKSAKRQYKSEEARTRMDYRIQQVDAELQSMKAALAAIDTKIELAMVAKDTRSADAGGLHTKESKELSDNADAVLKQANNLRRLLENEGDEPPEPKGEKKSPALLPDRLTQPTPSTKPATPALDREATTKEIRRLDASIATTESNLDRAWARVKVISHNHTVPVVRGTPQHQEVMALQRVIEDCEAQLPGMKNRRDELNAKLGQQ